MAAGSARRFEIEVFSTCPQSKDEDRTDYVRRVRDVARWSEEAGCRGILVYSDNGLVDPWLVSQLIIESTSMLSPLIAVQPIYMHPYACAKLAATVAYLYDRKLYLNMVAGGFRGDLAALGDDTPHDERYDRLVEYTTIVKGLTESDDPVSLEGRYYTVQNLKLTPPVPPELAPAFFVSGSSPQGLEAASVIGATAVRYPGPAEEEEAEVSGERSGIRVGIIARESDEEAWRVARERFPEDRKGQITHQVAMKVSDSQWHARLSRLGEATRDAPSVYWLGPFENYKSFCPYLVGEYGRVADEMGRYLRAGFRTFILDIPPSQEELEQVGEVFSRAAALQ